MNVLKTPIRFLKVAVPRTNFIAVIIITAVGFLSVYSHSQTPVVKQSVSAMYTPDFRYIALVLAYERYRDTMTHADFIIRPTRRQGTIVPNLVEGKDDIGFVSSLAAINLFADNFYYRVIGEFFRGPMLLTPNWAVDPGISTLADGLESFPASDSSAFRSIIYINDLESVEGVRAKQLMESLSGPLSDQWPGMIAPLPGGEIGLRLILDRSVNINSVYVGSLLQSPEVLASENIRTFVLDNNGLVSNVVVASDSIAHEKQQAIQEVLASISRAARDIELAFKGSDAVFDELVADLLPYFPSQTHNSFKVSLNHHIEEFYKTDSEFSFENAFSPVETDEARFQVTADESFRLNSIPFAMPVSAMTRKNYIGVSAHE